MKPTARAQARRAGVAGSAVTKQSELVKQTVRRMKKAERDERMTLTTLLTPVKTYMAGFTSPTDLKVTSWFAGGRYMSMNKDYQSPPPDAYEPHTIFLLESRYQVKFGRGRTESVDHVVGLCRAQDFEDVVARYNSRRAPADAIESMDNARWPWLKQKPVIQYSRPSWWSRENEIKDELKNEGELMRKEPVTNPHAAENIPPPGSTRRDVYHDDPLLKERQTQAVRDRVNETDLEGLHSRMRRPEGKIPFEVQHADGGTYHPSGFRVPTSEKAFAQERVPPPQATETRSPQPINPDAAIEYAQWKTIREKKGDEGYLMPDLADGLLNGDIVATTTPKDEKIPTEVAGVYHRSGALEPPQHASGFVPPTPAMHRGETSAQTYAVEHELTKEEKEAKVLYENEVKAQREHYFEHIKTEPFWRPLLAVTVSTRPIAATLTRLSRALSRGLPFYASVEVDGRKSLSSFGNRMRCLRLQRMQELIVEMAQMLAGARGGPIGVRFGSNEIGRGIDGESLAEPVPIDKRVIGVAIGEWYDRAHEVKDAYKLAQEDVQKYEATPQQDPFIIYGLDEFGKPQPEALKETLPWFKNGPNEVDEGLSQEAKDVFNKVSELKRLLKGDEDNVEDLYLMVESVEKKEDGKGYVEEVGDVKATTKTAPVPAGWYMVHGAQARGIVNRRIEWLSREHEEELTKAYARRSAQVTYP